MDSLIDFVLFNVHLENVFVRDLAVFENEPIKIECMC